MKALFHRLNRGLTKEKDKDSVKDRDINSTPTQREKQPLQLGPLPEWPPQRATSTPPSLTSFKPLPDLTARPLPPIEEPYPSDSPTNESLSTTTPPHTTEPSLRAEDSSVGLGITGAPLTAEPESTGRSSRKTTNGSVKAAEGNSDVQKKVAFLSPPPTPSGPSNDRPLPEPSSNGSTSGAPLKTSLSRFQAAHGKDPRGSTSTAASASRTDVGSTSRATGSGASTKATSTRTATSPYPQSVRSGTPYSQMSNASSRILAVTSWSEGAEEDLVSNLGPRERTRQEVLWEIVASEERYVNELLKMKETFIEPLLHPYASPPVSSTPYTDFEEYSRIDSPQESLEQLPIAARFMSPVGYRSEGASATTPSSAKKDDKDKVSQTPNIDGESLETDEEDENDDQMGKSYRSSRKPKDTKSLAAKHNHPRSPYRSASKAAKTSESVPFPSRSHHSLPPPPRVNPMTASSQSLGRQSILMERERDRNNSGGQASVADRKATPNQGSRVLRKFKKSQTRSDTLGSAVPPHQLPEDFRICLEVIESGVLDGHAKLSEGLKKRYDEQYPLVRSLADVFVSNSHIFQGYATYVLHLERALEQVDNALSTASAAKKPKNQDSAEWLKVCKYLQKLEENACDKGETGLAITLSKPFQRLLKYPLLFQNLLFHTDPSTFEYESTLQMVAEVETIVRSIEDEKIQKEDRDRTRDVFARIEGLDKVKQLAIPKPSRLLVEERQILVPASPNGSSKGSSPPSALNPRAVKGKTSFKRLSDVLGTGTGVGGKKDLWLVVFNDVVLRCQRTGTTSLPLVAATNSRTNSLPELQGKAKYASTGRRNSHTKPRNLYKFVKIETWVIGDVVQPNEGVVSMEDVVRSKAQVHSATAQQPKIVPLPDDDEEEGIESDDSDKKSKMSFSYWGADKVTLQKPVLKPKQHGAIGTTRRVSPGTSSYGRESSANAKFGTRLVSGDQTSPTARPASRRTQGTPSTRTRVAPSEDGHSMKATVTRPAWDTSTRSALTPTSKRPRQISQTSSATRATTTTTKQPVPPSPSEDSGL